MIRHYLVAALRNMAANKLQATIAIFGLAIGLAAAILAGIVATNQYSYDDFIPGHDRLYYAILEHHSAAGDQYLTNGPHELAALLKANLSGIEAVTRRTKDNALLRQGNVLAREAIYWADPNFFQLLPLPVLHGKLDHALDRPDSIVLPLAAARKYFGRDDVVGRTLEMDRSHVMTVTAVIADFPLNATTMATGIFLSNRAAFSPIARNAARPGMPPDGTMYGEAVTVVRLAPGASLGALNRDGSALVAKFVPRSEPFRRAMHFERLDQLHMSRQVNPGTAPRFFVMIAVALVILVLACVNFVNLAVARSTQRGREVAMRKASGAGRGALMVQFLGESVLQMLCALVMALILTEWALPAVNAFLTAGVVFDYWREPGLIAILLSGAMTMGIVAGAYPALILSSFRPALVLKGWMPGGMAGERVRHALVTLQFAILIALLIAAFVVFRQNRYATTEALRIPTDQILLVREETCDSAFQARVAALPGVRGIVCTSRSVLPEDYSFQPAVPRRTGLPGQLDGYVAMSMVPVRLGFFQLYDIRPVAGRVFRAGSGDQIPLNPAPDRIAHYVINETAARQLGYATPQAATGQTLRFVTGSEANHAPPPKPGTPLQYPALRGTIVGVVPDFSLTPPTFGPIANGDDQRIPAMAYSAGGAQPNYQDFATLLQVKLDGHAVPETLAGIDAAWKMTNALDPIDRTFLDTYIADLEIAVTRQGEALAAFAGIAMLLACLGLFGVSLSTAMRRTKEIGVRKAMGARDGEIVALLLWQFARPILWANVIAWPFAWWAMNRWLNGFAYHVPLNWWLFPAAGVTTLLIALATVAGQAWLVARQKPVLALRYE